MSSTSSDTSGTADTAGRSDTRATELSPLASEDGRTSVASVVVRKIAGVATREISGVHDLGAGGTRALGSFRQRIPGSSGPSVSQGVGVEVGEREAAVDLDVVIEYGASMVDVAAAIRQNVIRSVQRLTGLQVIEVNIAVDDVYVPQDDDPDIPSRVQ